MKARNPNVLIGLLALALSGSALAHNPGQQVGHPSGNWSGSATVWGGSQGYSGWSGNLSFGTVYGYAPGYVPWAYPYPAGHRHGPSCHHAPPRAYGHGHWKGYGHNRGHNRGHGRGRGHDPGRGRRDHH
jgi:hypothetical protein